MRLRVVVDGSDQVGVKRRPSKKKNDVPLIEVCLDGVTDSDQFETGAEVVLDEAEVRALIKKLEAVLTHEADGVTTALARKARA